MTEEPIKAFVIAYEGALDHLTIPGDVLARAEAELDAERERRRLAAEAAQAAAEAARKPSLWARVLAAIFFRRRRP